MLRYLLAASLLSLGLGAPAKAQTNPVPLDAAIYAKLDLKSVWQSATAKSLLDTMAKADPAMLLDFQRRFPVTPMDISGVTVFAMANPNAKGPPLPFGLVHMAKDVGPASIMPLIDKDARAKQVGEVAYFECPALEAEIRFVNSRTIMVGPTASQQFLAGHKAGTGALAGIIQKAETLPEFFLAVDASLVPAEAKQGIPPDFAPIAAIKTLQVSFDSKTSKLDLQLNYPDEAAAKSAHEAINKAIAMGRQELAKGKQEMLKEMTRNGDFQKGDMQGMAMSAMMLMACGGMNQMDVLLANPGLVVKGNQISRSIEIPDMMGMNGATVPIMIGLLLPAVQKVREAASRAQGQNNQKQMMLALHNYHDVNGAWPNDVCDKDGKPLLSWRVAILPYVEQDALYRKFKLDEPWDSANNKPLSEMVVKVYSHPGDAGAPSPMTHYQVFIGKGTSFEPGKKLTMTQMSDGTSNTGMIFEAKDAVVWTKPGDIPYDPKMDVASKLLFRNGQMTMVGFGDGSVRGVSNRIGAAMWHALITPNGGEILNLDENSALPTTPKMTEPVRKK